MKSTPSRGRRGPRKPNFARRRGASTARRDRKSTRLNSSHQIISYAVFCLKKKNTSNDRTYRVSRASSVIHCIPYSIHDRSTNSNCVFHLCPLYQRVVDVSAGLCAVLRLV